jgi:hypothetical protein
VDVGADAVDVEGDADAVDTEGDVAVDVDVVDDEGAKVDSEVNVAGAEVAGVGVCGDGVSGDTFEAAEIDEEFVFGADDAVVDVDVDGAVVELELAFGSARGVAGESS